jgi:hypothetical protein
MRGPISWCFGGEVEKKLKQKLISFSFIIIIKPPALTPPPHSPITILEKLPVLCSPHSNHRIRDSQNTAPLPPPWPADEQQKEIFGGGCRQRESSSKHKMLSRRLAAALLLVLAPAVVLAKVSRIGTPRDRGALGFGAQGRLPWNPPPPPQILDQRRALASFSARRAESKSKSSSDDHHQPMEAFKSDLRERDCN